MRAYEFYATPEDGIIRIPEQYKNKITTSVKVIVLEEKTLYLNEKEANERCKSDSLLSPTMTTKGWKFDRGEANER